MTKFVTPKEQIPRHPAVTSEVENPGVTVSAPRRQVSRSARRLWSRADGFTLSGPRRV